MLLTTRSRHSTVWHSDGAAFAYGASEVDFQINIDQVSAYQGQGENDCPKKGSASGANYTKHIRCMTNTKRAGEQDKKDQ